MAVFVISSFKVVPIEGDEDKDRVRDFAPSKSVEQTQKMIESFVAEQTSSIRAQGHKVSVTSEGLVESDENPLTYEVADCETDESWIFRVHSFTAPVPATDKESKDDSTAESKKG